MNYGKNEVEKTLRKTNSRSQKITSHLVLLLTKIILILVLFAAVLGISFGYGIFKGVIDAAPEIDVASIEPSGYATLITPAAVRKYSGRFVSPTARRIALPKL